MKNKASTYADRFLSPPVSRQKFMAGKSIIKMPDTDLDTTLLSLLTRQCHLYRQLRTLTREQRRYIAENNSEAGLEMIFKRQRLVKELVEINDKLRPIKLNWQKLSGGIEPQCKSKAQEIAVQVEGIVADIRTLSVSGVSKTLSPQEDRKCEELVFNTGIAKDGL